MTSASPTPVTDRILVSGWSGTITRRERDMILDELSPLPGMTIRSDRGTESFRHGLHDGRWEIHWIDGAGIDGKLTWTTNAVTGTSNGVNVSGTGPQDVLRDIVIARGLMALGMSPEARTQGRERLERISSHPQAHVAAAASAALARPLPSEEDWEAELLGS